MRSSSSPQFTTPSKPSNNFTSQKINENLARRGTSQFTRRNRFTRTLLLAAAFLTPCAIHAQTATALHQIQSDLQQALTGNWTGVLEYRDYSEPATSTKRVQLPTWLTIKPTGSSQTWHYLYDDGPNKLVEETDTLSFDPSASTYTESDNGKPSETRITLTIRRNLLTILEETRPAGSSDPFAFRHSFCFTRATPPATQLSVQ